MTNLPEHFLWERKNGSKIARITLNRPERKNPLTFESYAELRDLFRSLASDRSLSTVIITGAGDNFCSGGDVHDIIGPLTKMSAPELLSFTRLTGDLVRSIRSCPQIVIAAVDGIAAGAGAILAMVSDIRISSDRSSTAFLFNRVGLAGCDMGACTILPRIIGHGRATELLITGRAMSAAEGFAWGFWNAVVPADNLQHEALQWAQRISDGPAFANAMTKTMLQQEWNVTVDQALEMEAQAQALCMQTEDFTRAYLAFTEKRTPVFEGN